MKVILYPAAVSFLTICAFSLPVSSSVSGIDSGTPKPLPPTGDPRRCVSNPDKVRRFEVLPGGGWDNLRNKDAGMIVAVNYSECKSTEDGQFLLPDGIYTIPLKSSKIENYAELFTHWSNYTSTLSSSVNVHAGLDFKGISISGKFSDEYESVKSHQYFDRSFTTRIQARYVRYTAKLQPDIPLNAGFRARLRKIAADIELNNTELANYDSQLLVRDYGTHILTSVDAGAALVQIDQVHTNFIRDFSLEKNSVLAAASASFFGIFSFGIDYSRMTSQTKVDQYMRNRTSSVIHTFGGPVFRPSNYSARNWSEDVENNLVAVDRVGDPIHYVITPANLPDIPEYTVYQVSDYVQRAVQVYYKHNMYRGCTKQDSPNFSFQANMDDGSCKLPLTNFTFGGVFQKCTGSGYTDLCAQMRQKNPKTGDFSCPEGYNEVLLQRGRRSSSAPRRECHSCWLFFHCCNSYTVYANAEYEAYWCAASGPVPQNSGFLFGGLYTPMITNPLTQSASCPADFYALRLLSDMVVCVSDDYELGQHNALPFAGFYSCKAGNPLSMGNVNQSLQAKNAQVGQMSILGFMQTSGEYPHSCPKGYSQHLATVYEGCEINYCVLANALSPQGLPKIQRPPFMKAPMHNKTAVDVVLSTDGQTWMTMSEAEAKFNGRPETSTNKADDTSAGGQHGDDGLPAGVVAAIAVVATLVCIVAATFGVVKYRQKLRANTRYRDIDAALGTREGSNVRQGPSGSVENRTYQTLT